MNVAMVLAGGVGSRAGAGIPKQFVEVQGKPILAYTLEVLQNNPNIDAIEIVCHKDWIHTAEKIVQDYEVSKVKWLCVGGGTYQESTMNGVFNLEGILSDNDVLVCTFGVPPIA